jgi:hypothetical protein
MLPIPGEEPLWKVLQVRGILAKCKDLIARNQETERPGACPTTSRVSDPLVCRSEDQKG